MTPEEKKTIVASIELYLQSFLGKNYSLESIKAYLSDLAQFLEWLKTRRGDHDILQNSVNCIVEFINH
jgi:hypothetical protein